MIIIGGSICLDDITNKADKSKLDKASNGKTYMNVSIFVGDELDKFGNNVTITQNQTKEEREAKEKKVYIGNGRVVFVRGDVKTAKDMESQSDDTPDF